MNAARQEGAAEYDLHQHVLLMIAVLAESRLLPAAAPLLHGPAPRPPPALASAAALAAYAGHRITYVKAHGALANLAADLPYAATVPELHRMLRG